MRQIKFRGHDSLKWVFGGYHQTENGGAEYITVGDFDHAYVDKETIGQFTGITDARGVDVYDGDILRIPAKSEFEKTTYNCFEVFYHDNECIGGFNVGFCMNRMHSHGSSAGGQCYKFTPESIAKNGFVVIGNIHQNKNLLGG